MSEPVLKVENINVYYGSIHAIKGISFEVYEGEIVTLIGANGAGKSTFLKILSGEVEHTSGEIAVDSGLKIGVLGQDQFAFEDFTLKDAVLYGNGRVWHFSCNA